MNGSGPDFTFPRTDRARKLASADAAPYSATRRKLDILCVGIGDPMGDKYTIRSPKNLFPTASIQMRFGQRELNIIGHWSNKSKMPERYDRIVCAAELLLRNAIAQKMIAGWVTVEANHLPATVANNERTGRSDAPRDIASTETQALGPTHRATPERTPPAQLSEDGSQSPDATLGAHDLPLDVDD